MAKYRYIGKSSINIQNGEVLDQEPTTWSVKCGEGRKEIQVLYVKNYKGYDTPIRLSEFELCEGKKDNTGERQLTIPVVTNRYLFFYEDEGEQGYTFEIEAKDHEEAFDKAYESYGPQVEDMMYRLI